MTYFKPCSAMEIDVLDKETGETNPVISIKAGITTYTEQIIGKATVRVGYYDDQDNHIGGDRWVTTDIPGTLLAAYRKVINSTATLGSVDYFASLILNSPEGNAAIPS